MYKIVVFAKFKTCHCFFDLTLSNSLCYRIEEAVFLEPQIKFKTKYLIAKLKMFTFAKNYKSRTSVLSKLFSTKNATPFKDEIIQLQNSYSNIPPKILDMVDRKLYLQPAHPLGILSDQLKAFFTNPDTYKSELQQKYKMPYYVAETLNPITTVQKNFDNLLIPKDHVSRKRSDTYYINEQTLLRTHTSCHQKENIEKGIDAFITISDVYRRDEIDATHYPCFHQVLAFFDIF